jgi:hypothetical protein
MHFFKTTVSRLLHLRFYADASLVAKSICFSLYATMALFGHNTLADYSLKRVVNLETGSYYSFSGLTKKTTTQEIESGVELLGYETYKEIKDPLFLLNYGIETYFSRNWYETGGYRFNTYGSTGPKGVAAKTSWVTPDPQEIPFRKWNVIAPDKSYTNQSTTLLLKPFQSRALPPGSVTYGYFVVSVVMFTPNGALIPPQQIRVAGKILDNDGNAYITAELNGGYINITPTTLASSNYEYTLAVTELTPKIELFEPSSKSKIIYVDDRDNDPDTFLAFVRRCQETMVVFVKPNLPAGFYVNNRLPGFLLSGGIYDAASGFYRCEVDLSVYAATDVYCSIGSQYKKLKVVVYDAQITGYVQNPNLKPGTGKTAFGHTWWSLCITSPAKEIAIKKKLVELPFLDYCGYWPADSGWFPNEANPITTVTGELVLGDQSSTMEAYKIYMVDISQFVNAGQKLVEWKKQSDSGREVYNIIFRNCTTAYIEFSNAHALSNIPTTIYKPSELYKYWIK